MIDQVAIRREFRNRLLDMDDAPDESVVKVENKSFVPPQPPDLWIRETLIPGEETLLATNELELLGILQYDVFVPLDTGCVAADQMARNIGQLFKPTVGFQAVNEKDEQFQVCVYRATLVQGSEQDVWYMRPVRIYFRAYAPNNSDT